MDLLAVRSLLPGYLELLDPLLHFAHFGQQPAENTVGRKELRIRLDRTLRIRNSFFEFAALLIFQGNGDQSLSMFRVQFQLSLKPAQAASPPTVAQTARPARSTRSLSPGRRSSGKMGRRSPANPAASNMAGPATRVYMLPWSSPVLKSFSNTCSADSYCWNRVSSSTA